MRASRDVFGCNGYTGEMLAQTDIRIYKQKVHKQAGEEKRHIGMWVQEQKDAACQVILQGEIDMSRQAHKEER